MERLDQFMARANAAYYATRDPFKDFTTSPEISQVFGEILGLWAAVTWRLIGRPDPVLLVEAGPGRATLMADALRAIGRVADDFRAALRLHLIETSPRLRAVQAERLPDAVWHENLDTVPEAPMVLLANEFLDALPIRQFVRRRGGWMERFVAEGKFVELPASPTSPLPRAGDVHEYPASDQCAPAIAKPRHGSEESDMTVVEICESSLAFARSLCERLASRRGAALFLDYGQEHSAPGDSLQALRNGRPVDPLSAPGTADITAHVDFAAFAAAARSSAAAVHGPVPQGIFLTRLGLFQRTDALARRQPPARAAALIDAAQRLAEPYRMGRLFKALALCHPDCPTPPGFESDAT